jgi:hypothetical protein
MDSKKLSVGALALSLGLAGLAQAADLSAQQGDDVRVDVSLACDDGCNGQCNGQCGGGGGGGGGGN